jgi:hypothetical protein
MKLCLTSNFTFCEKDANLKILGHKGLLSAIILEAKFCLYDCIFFFQNVFDHKNAFPNNTLDSSTMGKDSLEKNGPFSFLFCFTIEFLNICLRSKFGHRWN